MDEPPVAAPSRSAPVPGANPWPSPPAPQSLLPSGAMAELPVVSVVLGLLDPVEICRSAATCSSWHIVASDPSLWEAGYAANYGPLRRWQRQRHGKPPPDAHCGSGATLAEGDTRWFEHFALAFQLSRREHAFELTGASVACSPRAGHAAVLIPGGSLVAVFGGCTMGYRNRSDMDLVDLGGKQAVLGIKLEPKGAVQGWLQSAVLLDGGPDRGPGIYLFGGSGDGHHTVDQLWRLDVGELCGPHEGYQRLQPIGQENWYRSFRHRPPAAPSEERRFWPLPRAGHSASAAVAPGATCFYCFGGRGLSDTDDGDEECVLNDLLRFDAVSEIWTKLAPAGEPPTPRWCHASALLQVPHLRLVVFGGWAKYPASVFLNDTHIYDLAANTWEEIRTGGAIPTPRCQSVLCPILHETCLFLFGGAAHQAGSSFALSAYGDVVIDLCDLHVLDLTTQCWVRCHGNGYPALRGGVNAVVRTPCSNASPREQEPKQGDRRSVLDASGDSQVWVLGGMHSDSGSQFPVFKGDVAALSIRLHNPLATRSQ